MKKSVLVLAGIDPSGGAGLAADIRVLDRIGVHPVPVPISITIQSVTGLKDVFPFHMETAGEMVREGTRNLDIGAVKIGLVPGPGYAKEVRAVVPEGIPVVLDPVLAPTRGREIYPRKGMAYALVAAFADTDVVFTPNEDEFFLMAGTRKEDGVENGASALAGRGIGNLVVTGVEEKGAFWDMVIRDGTIEKKYEREDDLLGEVHGTGCAFSSALAGYIALGIPLDEAAGKAGDLVARLRRASWKPGEGMRMF